MRRWICRDCFYIYEPMFGEQDYGIPPGIPFEDLLDDYRCPNCGAPKSHFSPIMSEMIQ